MIDCDLWKSKYWRSSGNSQQIEVNCCRGTWVGYLSAPLPGHTDAVTHISWVIPGNMYTSTCIHKFYPYIDIHSHTYATPYTNHMHLGLSHYNNLTCGRFQPCEQGRKGIKSCLLLCPSVTIIIYISARTVWE